MVNGTPQRGTISPQPQWSEAATPQVFSGLGPGDPVISAADPGGAGAK